MPTPDLLLPARRGLRGVGADRLLRLIYRIIFVRFLFHLFGFWGGIAVLVAAALGIVLWTRYRRRR
ncbi:MAG TPA: hypothetical protein VFJ12_15130 [Segeticoccus sp.]|nr:hypothetical protein [Segeticoccus sp.]